MLGTFNKIYDSKSPKYVAIFRGSKFSVKSPEMDN